MTVPGEVGPKVGGSIRAPGDTTGSVQLTPAETIQLNKTKQ